MDIQKDMIQQDTVNNLPLRDPVLEDMRNKALRSICLPKSLTEQFDIEIKGGYIHLTEKKKKKNEENQ